MGFSPHVSPAANLPDINLNQRIPVHRDLGRPHKGQQDAVAAVVAAVTSRHRAQLLPDDFGARAAILQFVQRQKPANAHEADAAATRVRVQETPRGDKADDLPRGEHPEVVGLLDGGNSHLRLWFLLLILLALPRLLLPVLSVGFVVK